MAIGRFTSFAAGAQTHQAKQPDTQIFVNLYFYLTTTTKKKVGNLFCQRIYFKLHV